MALAEKLHHSAQPVMEQHVVPRELKTASAREGEEFKKNALYEALRGQKTPLPGVRTVSTAPVPQVALPDLGGDVVHDDTLVAFLVRQTLLEKEEEKRKEEEEVRKVQLAQVKAAKKEMRERRQEMLDELLVLRRNFLPSERTPSVERRIAQLVSALEASASSKPPTRKRKKRRGSARLQNLLPRAAALVVDSGSGMFLDPVLFSDKFQQSHVFTVSLFDMWSMSLLCGSCSFHRCFSLVSTLAQSRRLTGSAATMRFAPTITSTSGSS